MAAEAYESVFSASNDHVFDRAEETCKAQAIECHVSLEALPEVEESNVCFQRLVLQVSPADAARCRAILREAGFSEGIVG